MVDTDEFHIAYEEDGREILRELDRVILSKGAWSTVMFLYQERGRNSEEFGAPKVRIQRYRKTGGVYRPQSRFNISSARQGAKIIEALQRWYPADE